MMFIKMLINYRKNGGSILHGTELSVQDTEAFELIENGSAEPANRGARSRYEEMKAAKIAATPPEGPDIRHLYEYGTGPETLTVFGLKR